MYWKKYAFIMLLLCVFTIHYYHAIAQKKEAFTIDTELIRNKSGLNIDQELWVHMNTTDETRKYALPDLALMPFQRYSEPLEEGIYWIEFALDPKEYDDDLYLKLNNEISEIEFYQITSKDTIRQYSGGSITPKQKSHLWLRDNIFKIKVIPEQISQVYFKIKVRDDEILAPKAQLYEIRGYEKNIGLRTSISLVFTSIFLTLALYNFFIYWILKEKVYFYYSFMVLGFATHAGIPFLYTAFPASNVDTLSIAVASCIIFFGAMFSVHFLGLRKLRLWYTLTISLAYVSGTIAFLILGELLLLNDQKPFDYITSLIAAFSSLALFLLWIISSIKIWNTKDKRGKYFLLTNIPALAGAFVFTLVWFGATFEFTTIDIDNSLIVNIIFYSGMTIQLLLFSAIFGYYIRKLEREKLEIQANINLHLEEKVNERTATLQAANLKIKGQKDELKSLNAIKDKLLSIISHDLRSPLNSLRGMLALFNSGTVTVEEMKDYSFKINDALSNTSTVLNNMLNWAKSQMSGIEVHPSRFDIKSLISENESLITPLLDKKSISLINTVEPTDVRADRNMIDLVIRNLLSNAIKFTNVGGNIVIESSKNNDYLDLQITDDGVGMSNDKLNSLFNITLLEPSTGTLSEKGTGLGLILSKDFVEMNGGTLQVKSKEGKGSTFILTLPLGVTESGLA